MPFKDKAKRNEYQRKYRATKKMVALAKALVDANNVYVKVAQETIEEVVNAKLKEQGINNYVFKFKGAKSDGSYLGC